MGRYTDLHLHLLPNVDDGPSSEDEALELARFLTAGDVGTATVTPHFNAWSTGVLSTKSELDERLTQLREVLSRNLVELELFSGAEHLLTPDLLSQLEKGEAPLLGPGPYLLVELPFHGKPSYASQVLAELIQAGFRPVLAHPERYSWVQTHPEEALELVDEGIALQCTAASLAGHYGSRIRKTAEALLLEGAYQLVGSDLHHPNQPRRLMDMEESVRNRAGDDMAETLFITNPARVLNGEPLKHVPAVEVAIPKQRRLFGFINL